MVIPSGFRWLRRGLPTGRQGRRRHAGRFTPRVSLLEERSLPSFVLSGSFDTGGTVPFGTVVADFNGDGVPDVATANSNFTSGGNGSISVFLGNGDGTLQDALTYRTTGPNTRVLAVADFNGDGNLDLAAVNWDNNVSVFLGNGDGTFQPPDNLGGAGLTPHSITTADFNGDGIPDLAWTNFATNTVSVLLGNGDGSFRQPVNFSVGAAPRFVVPGDFDGDGNIDLAVANQNSSNVSILLGNGDGTFQKTVNYQVGRTPYSMAVGDLNGDGAQDLVVTDYVDNTISVLVNNGDGTFQKAVNYDTGMTPASVALADLDGDGTLDLAYASYDNFGIFYGNGDGTFQPPVNSDKVEGPSWITTADLNGDGLPDLVVTSGEDASVNVFLNQPDGSAAAGQRLVHAPNFYANENVVTAALVPRARGFDAVVSGPLAIRKDTATARQGDTVPSDPHASADSQIVATFATPRRGDAAVVSGEAFTLTLDRLAGNLVLAQNPALLG